MNKDELKQFHDEQITYIETLDKVVGGKLIGGSTVEEYLAFLKAQNDPLALELLLASLNVKPAPRR